MVCAPRSPVSRLPFRCLLWCCAAIAVISGDVRPAHAVNNTFSYRCVLTGAQEVGPVATTAFGGGELYIDAVANTVTYRIVVFGLSGAETAAHIHGMAAPGANAGVLHTLPAGSPKVGVWNFAESQQADILAGRTYVNVHSTMFPAGEVRGQVVPLNAQLDGAQEVGPVATPASGWGVFTIDPLVNELRYHVVFTGLSGAETAAHIHGPAIHGTNAGVLLSLPAGSPKIGTWLYAETQEADILNGRTYVNVHSAAFPGGEIRGQIVPTVVPIDGLQEVGPVVTPATGIGLISIDQAIDDLGYDIRISALSGPETAAHIHGFAPPGMNAGVVHTLPAGPRKLGVWAYAAGQEASILAGLSYINVHSMVFAGGEIRGQIQGLDCPQPTLAPGLLAPADPGRLENSPNPFAARTTIRFELARETRVQLHVVDVAGRRVRNLVSGTLATGPHQAVWDGRSDAGGRVASGVYYYVLQTGEGAVSRSMTLVR
jgi:hypothetical protein